MAVSSFTFLMSFFWCQVFILLAAFILYRTKFVNTYGVNFLLVLMSVGVLRLFVPLELPFSIVLRDYYILPVIFKFFTQELFNINGIPILHYYIWFFVWGLGALLLLARFVRQIYQEHAFIRQIPSLENTRELDMLKGIAESQKFHKPYQLIVTDQVDMPLMAGYTTPTILLPSLPFTDEELDAVLTHELTHFIHRDLWKCLGMKLLCIFFWWNPFIYLLKRDFNHALEVACDYAVAQDFSTHQRKSYVSAVVKVLHELPEVGQKPKLDAVAFASATDALLVNRCESILHPPKKLSRYMQAALSTAMVALLLFSYSFVVQTAGEPPYIPGEIVVNFSESYLVPIEGGGFAFYMDGVFIANIKQESVNLEPFIGMPIVERDSIL